MMGSILAKFDFSDIGLVDNPGQFSFRQRMTSSRQVKEFATLLLYLAKTKSPYLHICLEPMLNDSQYSAEDVYNNALIPKMMYYLATEAPIDGDHLPTIRHWTLCRCFEVKDGNLRLQDTGHVSSFLSTALYMIRASTAYGLTSMCHNPDVHPCGQQPVDLIHQVQKAIAIQKVSEAIGTLRIQKTAEAKQNPTEMDCDGNILVGDVTFYLNDVRNAIPALLQKCWYLQ